MARECRKETEYVQYNQTSGWSGTGDETKGKPGKSKAGTWAKASLARAKTRTREKEKAKTTRQRKTFTRWRSTKTNTKHNPVKSAQSGVTRVGITLTSGLTQIGCRATGAQICRLILRGGNRKDTCHRHSQLKNSPIRHKMEAFRC